MRTTWKVITEVINSDCSKTLITKIKVKDKLSNDPLEIANEFNNFFVSIGSRLASSIAVTNVDPLSYLKPQSVNSMVLFPTNCYEVSNVIKALKNSKNTGIDRIPVSVVKFACIYISHFLATLINLTLETERIISSQLKEAKVVPKHKAGVTSEVSNYRPISILNVFSKVYEKVISKRLKDFLSSMNILCDKQFGFREGNSTAFALTTFVDMITEAMDKKEAVISVFVDVSKAFDVLSHDILLNKLFHYGVRGTALSLFKSYLADRFQRVVYDNSMSSVMPIKTGVPQGSVLGPLLFILFINDIEQCSSIMKFFMFADDTTIIHSAKNSTLLIDEMNKEL